MKVGILDWMMTYTNVLINSLFSPQLLVPMVVALST